MPLMFTAATGGGTSYASPFVGPVDHTAHVKLDISAMTTDEVDADGYLKPGVPLKRDGTPVGAGEAVWGVTVEATKVAAVVPPTNTTLDAETDCFVAVCTVGTVNRDIAEDDLGRAYTADEIAGFAIAGSTLHLTST